MIRMAMMPRDTNVHGTIFGGVILSQIDQAGAIACRACGVARVVTVSMKEVVFREPVYVGRRRFLLRRGRQGRDDVDDRQSRRRSRAAARPAARRSS